MATGIALSGIPAAASAYEPSSDDALLEADPVQSLERAVPGVEFRSDRAITTHRTDVGKTIQVRTRRGTLYATELPEDTLVSVFRFPDDVPSGRLRVEGTVPDGTKGMLVGTEDGARLLRSASDAERSRILRELGLPDGSGVDITTTAGSGRYEVTRADYAAGRIERHVVTATPHGFERTGKSTVTAAQTTPISASDDCDCGEFFANLVLCFHSLSGCQTAFKCAPFGGPKVVALCAFATGCVYSILSEIFVSDMPGCVNLGSDIWDVCVADCV